MVLNVIGRGAIASVQYTGDDSVEEITKLLSAVVRNEDDFEAWTALVGRVTELEGGVNRNSSPASIEFLRNVFDVFLAKFPLFFGYWKRYADIEFSIGGTEAAELVYERGVSCVTVSVDLWKDYCQFKMETSHVNEVTRALFERGAHFVGLDFQSHPFWDKYIEFEERLGDPENVTKLYRRVFEIPSFQFGRYYEKFRARITTRPLEELLDESDLKNLISALRTEFPALADIDFDRQLRGKIDLHFYEIYQNVQAEVTKRWTFESDIKRNYFHVQDLADTELENWRKYLDFEVAEGDRRRTAFLFERCVVPTALYEEFWLRYARWMLRQNKGYENTEEEDFINSTEEDARLIYMRACCIFIPLGLPTARLHWARFEEKLERFDVARAIHINILEAIPDNVETYISLINMERRQSGNAAAIEMCKAFLDNDNKEYNVPPSAKCYLLVEQARIMWECDDDVSGARALYKKFFRVFIDSKAFWTGFLKFEFSQPRPIKEIEEKLQNPKMKMKLPPNHPKNAYELMRVWSELRLDEKEELSDLYMNDLLARGGKKAAEEFIKTDFIIHSKPNPEEDKKDAALFGILDNESDSEMVDRPQPEG